MAKRKTENVKMLTQYEQDCVWMSYRYCIGRHTIASHCHAGDIAKNAYGRMTKERTQFMSEDINNEIHSQLHYGNFVDMDWYGNIPKTHFKPLDVLYSILDKENIDTAEKMREIKSICIEWNRDKQDFDYSIYYFNENDKNKDLGRSLWDITDLEVWQQLANLFDLNSHKFCKLSDGTICEYYECWHMNTNQGVLTYEKRKHAVDSPFNWYINENCIVEDNINSIFGVQKVKEAQGAEMWVVSWRTTQPRGGYGCDFGATVCKAFLLEQDAKNFAQGLRDAHNLLQNTSYINIQITKQK